MKIESGGAKRVGIGVNFARQNIQLFWVCEEGWYLNLEAGEGGGGYAD